MLAAVAGLLAGCNTTPDAGPVSVSTQFREREITFSMPAPGWQAQGRDLNFNKDFQTSGGALYGQGFIRVSAHNAPTRVESRSGSDGQRITEMDQTAFSDAEALKDYVASRLPIYDERVSLDTITERSLEVQPRYGPRTVRLEIQSEGRPRDFALKKHDGGAPIRMTYVGYVFVNPDNAREMYEASFMTLSSLGPLPPDMETERAWFLTRSSTSGSKLLVAAPVRDAR